MEYRKLIKFGNSSHVISVPNGWLKKNNLNKGDTIYVEENGNNELILTSERKDKIKIEKKEIVIEVNSKNKSELKREIISAYINNYRTIKIIGSNIESISNEIRNLLKDLTGIEVLEQTKDHIIAKDFIDMKDVSIIHLIRRMDLLTRNMISDAKDTTSDKTYQSLMQRDKDINRILFLAYRLSKFYIENPTTISNKNFTLMDFVNLRSIADHLERVADETKRISRCLKQLKNNKKEVKILEEVYNEIETSYLNVMKAFYAKDKKISLKEAENTKRLIALCKEKSSSLKDKNATILTERFKLMITLIRGISTLMYN